MYDFKDKKETLLIKVKDEQNNDLTMLVISSERFGVLSEIGTVSCEQIAEKFGADFLCIKHDGKVRVCKFMNKKDGAKAVKRGYIGKKRSNRNLGAGIYTVLDDEEKSEALIHMLEKFESCGSSELECFEIDYEGEYIECVTSPDGYRNGFIVLLSDKVNFSSHGIIAIKDFIE